MPRKVQLTREEIRGAVARADRGKLTGSFFLDPVVRSSKALSKGVGAYRGALRKADEAVGRGLSKIPLVGRVFSETKDVPVRNVGRSAKIVATVKQHRASAPLAKAQKFMVPLLAFEGARHVLSSVQKARAAAQAGAGAEAQMKSGGEQPMTKEERQVLVKAASLIERLSRERDILIDLLAEEKHAKHATQVAREMAEKGLIDDGEIDKKAEELSHEKDLSVVKKAVSMVKEGMQIGRPESVQIEGMSGDLDPLTEYLVGYIRQ